MNCLHLMIGMLLIACLILPVLGVCSINLFCFTCVLWVLFVCGFLLAVCLTVGFAVFVC